MNSLDSPSPTVIRARRTGPSGPTPAAVLRERAAAIFGTAEPEAEPRAADGSGTSARGGRAGPGAGAGFGTGAGSGSGAVGRLRTWLFVRCGLEFKTVIALAVVLVVAGGLAFQHYRAGRPHTVRVPPPLAAAPPLPSAATTAPEVTVDIAGKVAKPGLRRLPKGARVADALTAAGGALPGTDTTALNLARPLADGEQVLVGVTPPPGAAAEPSPGSPGSPVSLNSATAAQLDALPGVGPVLAQHILDFRTQHGGYSSLQQLRQVPGIGDRKFATLKPLVQP